jgi:hypothetical protein
MKKIGAIIVNAAETVRIGGGKLFVSSIDETVRIRTSEREDACSDHPAGIFLVIQQKHERIHST